MGDEMAWGRGGVATGARGVLVFRSSPWERCVKGRFFGPDGSLLRVFNASSFRLYAREDRGPLTMARESGRVGWGRDGGNALRSVLGLATGQPETGQPRFRLQGRAGVLC